MNQIILEPTDVLFFRDGRPMSGSLAGHGAAWPLPDVTSHALHAALHRAGLDGVHGHDHNRNGKREGDNTRKFGSLLTAGPWPVKLKDGKPKGYYFSRPLDSQPASGKSVKVSLAPVGSNGDREDYWIQSSLPEPLKYAVGNLEAASKEAKGDSWISEKAFSAYLSGHSNDLNDDDFLNDETLADREATIGIEIDPDTGTTGAGSAAGKIYSAQYLRMRPGYAMAVYAEAQDKRGSGEETQDLIPLLLNGKESSILVGGQQRICTAHRTDIRRIPLPLGLSAGFRPLGNDRVGVKWVLLSPAAWPQMAPGVSKRGTERKEHPGGWLPNWVDPETGRVLLRAVSAEERRRRRSLNYSGTGYNGDDQSAEINGHLVAALVPKPLVVTGWALENQDTGEKGGAKSTHLAVPPGAVYYFEVSAKDASALASALNWHGSTEGIEIRNRRSTLLGEKGYGLGVCGTWSVYEGR